MRRLHVSGLYVCFKRFFKELFFHSGLKKNSISQLLIVSSASPIRGILCSRSLIDPGHARCPSAIKTQRLRVFDTERTGVMLFCPILSWVFGELESALQCHRSELFCTAVYTFVVLFDESGASAYPSVRGSFECDSSNSDRLIDWRLFLVRNGPMFSNASR